MKDSWNWLVISPFVLTLILLLTICAVFSGCYTITQGITMLSYLNKAIPLEQVKDEEFVRAVNDIRNFAVNELGLAESLNYTKYVEIDRDYLAAVVSASSKTSFKRYEWSYPVVGKLPYKGFFSVEHARREKEKLEKKGYDVWMRGVEAFSTLGWFKDPLYSYMRKYTPSRLADLIIHELVHATVFLKGHAKFNEEIAEFIGTEGSRLYIENRYGLDSAEYRQMLAAKEDSRNFVIFLQGLIAELEELYSSNQSADDTLKQKELIINNAKERFKIEYDSRFSSGNFREFSDLEINNAYLDLFRLYHDEDNFYADLFDRSGRDLRSFVTALKTLTDKTAGDNPRSKLENALLQH